MPSATRGRPVVEIVDKAGSARSGLPASRPDLVPALAHRPLPVPLSRDLPARLVADDLDVRPVPLGCPGPSLAPLIAFSAIGLAGAALAALGLAAIIAVVAIITAAASALVAFVPFLIGAAVLAAVGIAYGNTYAPGPHAGCADGRLLSSRRRWVFGSSRPVRGWTLYPGNDREHGSRLRKAVLINLAPFNVTTSEDDRLVTVAVEGELDLAVAGSFREALERAGEDGLVVDLSHLAFIDSSGIRALCEVHTRLSQIGRSLVVVCPLVSPAHRVLAVCGLVDVLNIVADPASAAGAVRGSESRGPGLG